MNFIAGALLLFMDEEVVFWALATIVEDLLPGYFAQDLVAAQVDQLVFKHMVRGDLTRDAVAHPQDESEIYSKGNCQVWVAMGSTSENHLRPQDATVRILFNPLMPCGLFGSSEDSRSTCEARAPGMPLPVCPDLLVTNSPMTVTLYSHLSS